MGKHSALETPLSLQETILANAMAGHIGDITIQYTLGAEGTRLHNIADMSARQFNDLAVQYQEDPKEALAWARESLLAIQHDGRLTEGDRSRRLDRYLDAYLSLTLKLDATAFPATPEGEVERGIPSYIPDGFIDLGGDRSLNAARRDREMIAVNKQTIFDRYRPVLKEVYSKDYSEFSPDAKKINMFNQIAQAVYFNLPYDRGNKQLGGGKVDLGQLSEGVCRHQALTFQVLAQAVGLTSRVLKNRLTVDGEYLDRHAANMIRLNHKWYVFDVTNPDFVTDDKGNNEWRPGVIRADRPPHTGEHKRYEGTQKHSGRHFVWDAHDSMYWLIDRSA